MEFDEIIIGSIFCDEIENQLLELGVEEDKILKYFSTQNTLLDTRIMSLKLVFNEIDE